MRSPTRLALIVVGLAAALYGTASLTGGWLGTPPWWEQRYEPDLDRLDTGAGSPSGADLKLYRAQIVEFLTVTSPRPGREWISGGVVAAGLALVAFAAWPRRRWTDVSA